MEFDHSQLRPCPQAGYKTNGNKKEAGIERGHKICSRSVNNPVDSVYRYTDSWHGDLHMYTYVRSYTVEFLGCGHLYISFGTLKRHESCVHGASPLLSVHCFCWFMQVWKAKLLSYPPCNQSTRVSVVQDVLLLYSLRHVPCHWCSLRRYNCGLSCVDYDWLGTFRALRRRVKR